MVKNVKSIEKLKARKYCLGNAKDAVFELSDAAILSRHPSSLAELSLSPVFRRQWHSTYEAVEDCNPSRYKLMEVYQGGSLGKLAQQLNIVCSQLDQRAIIVIDSQYGCASFVKQTNNIPCDKLMRLSSNRCFYGEPKTYDGRGRPRKHGHKLKLNDAATWLTADELVEVEDSSLGMIKIRAWHQLHFRQTAEVKLSLIRVEQLDSPKSKPLWLAWHGEQMPTLIELVKLYLRRFTIEHWYRFAKQRLHWTVPNLGTKEQCDRWSDLMPMMTWELWLARNIIMDNPLPWQKPQANLTPGRVAQSFGTVIATLGTPASSPKPRGKSSGWQKGKVRTKKIRYPIIKKGKGRFESQKKAKKGKLSA